MRPLLTRPSVSCIVAMLVQAAAAQAQVPAAAPANEGEEIFALGQVTVLGERVADTSSDDSISTDEIWNFNANTLTEAVKLVPGVNSGFTSNGRRNEGDISVRGFDRWRVPLSIDGIRVYLPADNRIDFNRFLTPDLGEIQIRKGYASVLDGPGALGGAVNLVTRKPTKEFEAEFQGGTSFDRSGDYEGWFGTALLGTRQESWYLQASLTQLKRDHWTLAKGFTPEGPAEDGGERNGSYSKDWRINVKAGFTPNETDEYSLSFTKQSGEKGAPLGVDFLLPNGAVRNPPYQPNNYWTWPYWDVQSAYWLSNTQLGDSSYVKTRVYYNEFENALFAWDDATYSSQSANGRFRSFYDDSAFGGSVEAGTSFSENSSTKAALHWRRDRHSEYNFNRPTNPTLSSTEPKQHNEERTWSLALEQSWSATGAVKLVAGVSYDHNERTQAEDFGAIPAQPPGLTCVAAGATSPCLYGQPLGNDNAFNWQTALQWDYAGNAQLGASISSRSRFPNNFERYSTRFGTAVPNPDLGSERAINYEVNWKAAPIEGAQVSAAVFFADVQNMIQTVIVQASPQLTQTRNVGSGHNHGFELAADWNVLPGLRVGANYSYLKRKIKDPVPANLQPTGVPDHLGFAYVAWQPAATVTVQPSVEFAGNRWTDLNGNATVSYLRIGRYTLANLQLTWRPLQNMEAVLGARNLFDRNFELASGFPEPGRTLFTKVRINFN
jgi:iron complex outermembrane receptor protein